MYEREIRNKCVSFPKENRKSNDKTCIENIESRSPIKIISTELILCLFLINKIEINKIRLIRLIKNDKHLLFCKWPNFTHTFKNNLVIREFLKHC